MRLNWLEEQNIKLKLIKFPSENKSQHRLCLLKVSFFREILSFGKKLLKKI